jgi:hypothetical protein
MDYARTSRNAGNRAAAGGKTRSTPAYHQRWAVRVTYLNNRTRGQWKAHGRYLARESATFEHGDKGAGFSREGGNIDLAERLQSWQAEGDERLWKLIVSPEFGNRVDLSRLTRDLMQRMEEELATKLECAAVEHHNTEHAHVHIALRGRRDNSDGLHLNRQFIQNRIREIAGDFCTRQLGYRTERDGQEAERREIAEPRPTSLDRRIPEARMRRETDRSISMSSEIPFRPDRMNWRGFEHSMRRRGSPYSNGWAWRNQPGPMPGVCAGTSIRFSQPCSRRRTGRGRSQHTERSCRTSACRSRFSIRHRWRRSKAECFHGQDENSGRNYLMLEATDAKVYFIHYTREMEEARSRGELRTNSFVRLKKLTATLTGITDLGGAERLLTNPLHLGDAARECLKSGVAPVEEGWGGWLGRYQAALCTKVREMVERRAQEAMRARQRGRDRSRGR